MRPDHTTADYASPIEALPIASTALSDDSAPAQMSPLTRVTLCFAWLFGIEAFLATNPTTRSRSDFDRRL